MKFTFLKFKKKSSPSLKSLQPQIFDTDLFWFKVLGLCLLILIITALIGFSFFYSQYFESYKKSESTEDVEKIMSISKLKGAIENRNIFINKQISLPRDPSL
jgi:anionic cell wall polymer biosynthesis LytR-Cps2A-Psr (LCP) family protein